MIIVKRSFGIFLIALLSSIGIQSNCYAETKVQQHVVAEGQTLYNIANFYNTNIDAIKQANLLRNDRITPGQLLRVPINLNNSTYQNNQYPSTQPTTPNQVQPPTKQLPPPNPNRIQQYQVKPNETLSSIAQKYNVSVNDIAIANGIIDINSIPSGTQLLIPAKGYASLAHNNTNIIKPTTPQLQRGYINYTVRRGETLSGIANRYNILLQDLANYNNKPNNYKVRIGEILRIPNKYYKIQNNTSFPNDKY